MRSLGRGQAGRKRGAASSEERFADVLGGAEVEFESGVQTAPPPPEPNRLIISIAGVGVAALIAGLLLLPGGFDQDTGVPEALPAVPSTVQPADTTAAPTTSIPVPRARTAQDDTTVAGADGVPPRLELLTTTSELRSAFSLVELSEKGDGEQTVRLLGLEGQSLAVDEPIYFRSTNWPSWPGAPNRPFITAGDKLVFLSRGQVMVTDLNGENQRTIGQGVTLVDGLDPNEFWVVGPGSRWVSLHRVDAPDQVPERVSMVDIGRPVAAVTGGLLVVPPFGLGIGGLAVWRPAEPLLPIAVPSGLDLLGATENTIILGDGERLVSVDATSGMSSELPLAEPLDMRRASLSPDGSLLALSQDHQLTTLGRLVVVDTRTGETVSRLDSFIDREFAWTSTSTIVTLIVEDQKFQLVEFNVTAGRTTTIATVRYPWVYVAAGV